MYIMKYLVRQLQHVLLSRVRCLFELTFLCEQSGLSKQGCVCVCVHMVSGL